MKKILPFLLFSGLTFGQDYKNLDSLQFEKVKNEFIAMTDKNLMFHKKGNEQGYQYLKYKNTEDETFTILYSTFFEGENKALDIKGIKKWNIKSISGKFLTLFPIWKKLVDSNAVAENITNKKEVKSKGALVDWKFSSLLEGGNFWTINITKHEPVQSFDYVQISFKKTKKGYEFNRVIKKEIEEQIKKDFATSKEGNYTAFYDVFSLDNIPKEIKLKSKLNR